MRFIYFLLPFVSSALASSLIQCPCQKQDCSKAADQCACENQNIVNKYFCCDANTAPPTDLGLKDCEPGKPSSLKVHNLQFCGGPLDLKCLPQDTCSPIPGNRAETPLALGLCSRLAQPGNVSSSSSSIVKSTITSTVFVTSTLVVSPTSAISSTSSGPISTSTVVVSPTSSSSSSSTTFASVPISTSTVVVVPISTSSSTPSVPIYKSTVVEVTTVTPSSASSSTPSMPITTSTVVKMTTVAPTTLVTVTTTVVVTASTKSSTFATI